MTSPCMPGGKTSLPYNPLDFWEVLVPLLQSILVLLLFALPRKKLHKIFVQSHTRTQQQNVHKLFDLMVSTTDDNYCL